MSWFYDSKAKHKEYPYEMYMERKVLVNVDFIQGVTNNLSVQQPSKKQFLLSLMKLSSDNQYYKMS